MFLFRRAIVLLIFTVSSVAFGQKHVVYPTIPPPPHTPQEILLLFSGNTVDERILLTLNNNRPDSLTTSIVVYTAAGTLANLPDITLVPQESKIIELSPLLLAAGLSSKQELGWIKLNYSGIRLEMGAQLTLYPTKNGPGFDSPRSLSSDFKSTERDAVFWMPEYGKAHLSLINSSAGSLLVKMRCAQTSEEFVIPAKTTAIRHIELPGGPIVRVGRVPVSCEIVSDGSVDALRPVGSVVASEYAAPIRFYDPKTATFSSLTAVGVDTAAETHVTVHNVSDAPVEFTPIVREAALVNFSERSAASRTLAPHNSAEVDVSSLLQYFQGKGISRVTLTLKTEAVKGAVVGAVTQISSPDKLVEDIPLRTSNPPAFARGSYPLRWDEDYTNLVTVTNTAEEQLRIGGQITAGDVTYVFKRADIAPGATITFDVDDWKRDGVPDVNGKTIPKDALYGKFHWIEMAGGKKAGLLGRTSLTSVKNRRKSSFSCGSTCEYNFTRQPYFDLQVFTNLPTNGAQNSAITEYDSLLNGNYYTYPIAYSSGEVWADNSAIVSFGPDHSTSTNIVESGHAAGTTNVNYNFYDTEYSYDPDFEECDATPNNSEQSGPTNVQQVIFGPVGTIVLGGATIAVPVTFVGGATSSPTPITLTLTSSGTGGAIFTSGGTIAAGGLSTVISSPTTVTIKGTKQTFRSTPDITLNATTPAAEGGGTSPDATNPQTFGVTAIPVNFVSPAPQYLSDGSLSFQYTFSSSSGSLSDLANCSTGETVFYPGSSSPYVWPLPMVSNTANPFLRYGAGNYGSLLDTNYAPTSYKKPYSATSFVSTQRIQWQCPLYMQGGYQPFVPDITITRSISQSSGGQWVYKIQKSGYTNTAVLP